MMSYSKVEGERSAELVRIWLRAKASENTTHSDRSEILQLVALDELFGNVVRVADDCEVERRSKHEGRKTSEQPLAENEAELTQRERIPIDVIDRHAHAPLDLGVRLGLRQEGLEEARYLESRGERSEGRFSLSLSHETKLPSGFPNLHARRSVRPGTPSANAQAYDAREQG
jgi:hypothetical protein